METIGWIRHSAEGGSYIMYKEWKLQLKGDISWKTLNTLDNHETRDPVIDGLINLDSKIKEYLHTTRTFCLEEGHADWADEIELCLEDISCHTMPLLGSSLPSNQKLNVLHAIEGAHELLEQAMETSDLMEKTSILLEHAANIPYTLKLVFGTLSKTRHSFSKHDLVWICSGDWISPVLDISAV